MSLEYLLRACAEGGDEAAWREFVSHLGGLIGAVVLKTARRWGDTSPNTISDLIQETYLKLCANRARMLAEFGVSVIPNAFYGYLKVATANVVNDHYRARHSKKRNSNLESWFTDLATEIADPGMGSPEQIRRYFALLAEVETVLNSITQDAESERDRTIFWLYWRQGMTAQSISELPGMTLTGQKNKTAIYRLTRRVRERLAGQRYALDASAEGQAS